MAARTLRYCAALLIVASAFSAQTEAGVIKDLFSKVTGSNNKTEDTVKQSAPICGSGLFSTPDENTLSPEIILITNRPSKSKKVDSSENGREHKQRGRENERRKSDEEVNEVAHEFRFNVENVTLQELEEHGFNRDAPVTFLMHGFTSGYPLQAWMSAIVESYIIDRETLDDKDHGKEDQSDSDEHRRPIGSLNNGNSHETNHQDENHREDSEFRRARYNKERSKREMSHNLFVINWNYAARGILYPRAVANIPIVASYATRFINDKLIREAHVDPKRIQLIGHSLGAHLAGFIGKNTETKIGRIYGLDPAGPCFGAISGSLYPSSNRLAPTDADEVITIHTNTVLLGIDKPLGKHAVYVEGGEVQPGCKGGGVLKSLSTLTWDNGDFDTVACSHSRAPNLLTYRHEQSDSQDDCQLVAYECKDWDSYNAGQCGVCRYNPSRGHQHTRKTFDDYYTPMRNVECMRIGLDWQYPSTPPSGVSSSSSSSSLYGRETSRRPSYTTPSYDRDESYSPQYGRESTRRPYKPKDKDQSDTESTGSQSSYFDTHKPWERKPSSERNRRDTSRRDSKKNSTREREPTSRREEDESEANEAKSMFLKTGDTQPYCVYQYQVILELNEPFVGKKKPPMSLLLQDSEVDNERRRGSSSSSSSTGSSATGSRRPSSGGSKRSERNSLSSDEFGNKFDDKIYTHLLTSGRKLKRVDHGTILFRDGLPGGHEVLKAIHINYMSHYDPYVRRKFSSKLCPVKTETDHNRNSAKNRFYFEPCEDEPSSSSYHKTEDTDSDTSRRPNYNRNSTLF